MRLRIFEEDDAPVVLGWIANKSDLRKWSADRYPTYPPSPCDMVAMYRSGGVCPLTAVSDMGVVVGHLILRVPDGSKPHQYRLGFIIIDPSLRGKGYGKELVLSALSYARDVLCAESVSLGVFLNNPSALHCYEAVGFVRVGQEDYTIDGVIWPGMEMVYKFIPNTGERNCQRVM